MKIGVLSDTHDRLPTFERALSLFKRLKVDAVIHAGDYIAPFAAKLIAPDVMGETPVHCVYGNNDGEKAGLKGILPQIADGPLRIRLGGKTIVTHHFIDWLKPADTQGADIVITGHTHAVVNEVREGRLYLNPGECCGWVGGRCTVALLDLDKPAAEIIEVRG